MTLQSQITPSYRNEDAYRDHAPTLRPVAGYDKHEALRMEDAMLDAMRRQPEPPKAPSRMKTKARALLMLFDRGPMPVRLMAKRLQVKTDTLRRALHEMHADGLLTCTLDSGPQASIWRISDRACQIILGDNQ